jgi:hypothetical protein
MRNHVGIYDLALCLVAGTSDTVEVMGLEARTAAVSRVGLLVVTDFLSRILDRLGVCTRQRLPPRGRSGCAVMCVAAVHAVCYPGLVLGVCPH